MPDPSTLDYDVIVVGAGLAGLTAARELHKRAPDLKILVLEAKDRVGGRTLTKQLKVANHRKDYFDLGGQWVGHTQKHILELLDELGLTKYPQYDEGAKWAQLGISKPRKYHSSLPIYSIRQLSLSEVIDTTLSFIKIERMARKIDILDIFRSPQATQLDGMTVAEWTRQNCYTRACQDAFDIAIRGVYGTEANRMNMLYHLVYSKSAGSFSNLLENVGDGAQAMRVKDGTQQISERLAKELGDQPILLKKAVTQIEIDEKHGTTKVYVKNVGDKISTPTTYSCSQVILAIPPNQCGKIEFSPKLPLMKRRLYDNAPQGHMLKFIITYETTFWRKDGFTGEIISTGRTIIPGEVMPIVVAYDATSASGSPAIVGFITEEFVDCTKEERCNAVVSDLIRFFGDKALKEFIDYEEKVWSHEEYNGGCPVSIIGAGNMDAWQSIREPFYTVHFAGTETAIEWMGYMSGAVESGLRASHEVLKCLEKYNALSYNNLKGTIYDSDYKQALPPSNYYKERRSPWFRRIFFFGIVLFGVYAYSKKYELSFFSKAIRPFERTVLKMNAGIDWP